MCHIIKIFKKCLKFNQLPDGFLPGRGSGTLRLHSVKGKFKLVIKIDRVVPFVSTH